MTARAARGSTDGNARPSGSKHGSAPASGGNLSGHKVPPTSSNAARSMLLHVTPGARLLSSGNAALDTDVLRPLRTSRRRTYDLHTCANTALRPRQSIRV